MAKTHLLLPTTPTCYEKGCPAPVAWRVNTAAGWLSFCDLHAAWYIARPPEIYPRTPLHPVSELVER